MLLEGVSFVKTLVTLKLFTQQTHFYKIWLRSLASVDSQVNSNFRARWLASSEVISQVLFTSTLVNLTINSCRPCWISVRKLFKIRVVFNTVYLWNEVGDPQFFCISDTSNSLSDCSNGLKITNWLENFRANVLKFVDEPFLWSCNRMNRTSL